MKVEDAAMAEARKQVADEAVALGEAVLARAIRDGKHDNYPLVREAYYATRARGGDDEG